MYEGGSHHDGAGTVELHGCGLEECNDSGIDALAEALIRTSWGRRGEMAIFKLRWANRSSSLDLPFIIMLSPLSYAVIRNRRRHGSILKHLDNRVHIPDQGFKARRQFGNNICSAQVEWDEASCLQTREFGAPILKGKPSAVSQLLPS